MRIVVGGSRGEARRWAEASGHPGPDLIVSSDQASALPRLSKFAAVPGDIDSVHFVGAWWKGKMIDEVVRWLRKHEWTEPLPETEQFVEAREDTAALAFELREVSGAGYARESGC